jgi:predicted HAD superfamily Cof-like phosphohydrolase
MGANNSSEEDNDIDDIYNDNDIKTITIPLSEYEQLKNRKTNFEKIAEFQESFEMRYFNKITPEKISDNPDLMKLRISLIDEEVEELKEAIKTNDIIEMRDAIGDILYVVYGAGQTFGFDCDSDFTTIHDSNMSKLCKDEEEAKATVAKYENNFKNGNSRYDSPYYYHNEEKDIWIVKNKSTGKVLKSINYTPVNFE